MLKYMNEDGKLICVFSGKLDTADCTLVQNELYDKVSKAKPCKVVFDMKEVDYISSLFLGMCMHVFKDAGQSNFCLVNVHPNVKKVFKISGLDKQINIC